MAAETLHSSLFTLNCRAAATLHFSLFTHHFSLRNDFFTMPQASAVKPTHSVFLPDAWYQAVIPTKAVGRVEESLAISFQLTPLYFSGVLLFTIHYIETVFSML